MDPITDELIEQIKNMPIAKKKALLELIKPTIKKKQVSPDEWRKHLLSTSV